MSTKKGNLQPFVKWAGGKRQLIDEIIPRMPKEYGSYYEPFVGGGALLFYLQPEDAYINDINTALINTYFKIKESPEELIFEINKLDDRLADNPKELYYQQRDVYNVMLQNQEIDIKTAALFIFLNKHCFNGLYRVNAKGLFNVPFNGSKAISCNVENIRGLSKYLSTVHISNVDFEEACKKAKERDFIFFDSPYAPINPTSFESYTKEGFLKEDHKRLSVLFKELSERGCFCMLTNHNTDLIQDLYRDYKIDIVQVKRAINSNAKKRTGTEVIICNY